MKEFQIDTAQLTRPALDRERMEELVGGLPDASGTFTGTFDSGAVADLFDAPVLVPVEIDTYDEPNSAADLMPGQHVYLDLGDGRWAFEVDHVEPLGGNRVRVWCYRPVHHSVE
jgi:hypothetical protein